MEIIKLNLIPSGVNPTCHCSQYDDGRVIRIELFDGLTPYALKSGDAVTLNVRKPDNTIVTASVTATQGNKYVDIVTTEQICACVGYNLCDLTITNGSVVIGTLNFIMQVERDVLADGIPSQSVIEDLDALVQEAVGDNYYTKTEVDAALALKANSSDVYTKTEVNNLLDLKADKSELLDLLPTDTVSGDIANLPDGANNAPVKSFKANITATQSGSGDPSPSNVRTISGFTSADITRLGKNLFNGVFFANSAYTNANFDVASPNTQQKSIKIWLSAGTYTISFGGSNPIRIIRRLIDGGYVTTAVESIYFYTFTVQNDGFVGLSFRREDNTAWTDINIQIEKGENNTAYEAYNALDYIVSWQTETGTIYGGYLSYDNGSWTITITHALIELDGTENWSVSGNAYRTSNILPNAKTATGRNIVLCNRGKYLSSGVSEFGCWLTSGWFYYIPPTTVTTESEMKTWVSNNKLQVWYPIAEPVTYGLSDNTVIETMLGVNNFYADCGSVELTYRADIKLYVDKRVSQIPAALGLSRGLETLTQREDPIETPTNDEER